MRRILFVDDEQSVLDGLRSLLRRERGRWDVVFSLGGTAALAELAVRGFDAVVTDLRMPGMDGATLLERIREHYPQVMRIVLSGHADGELMRRAARLAHQCLTKPCDLDRLRAAVERTCELRESLAREPLAALLRSADQRLSVDPSSGELWRAVERPTITAAEVALLVHARPAMTKQLDTLVHEIQGGVGETLSLHQGLARLARPSLVGLLLTAHLLGTLEAMAVPGFSTDAFGRRALRGARLARRFLRDPEQTEEAFTAGLLRDVGMVLLLLARPDLHEAIAARTMTSGQPLPKVEEEILATTHAELGAAWLAGRGLPFSVVETVAHHHQPSRVTQGDRDVLAAVHVADALVDASSGELGSAPSRHGPDLAFLEAVGLSSALPRWRSIAASEPT